MRRTGLKSVPQDSVSTEQGSVQWYSAGRNTGGLKLDSLQGSRLVPRKRSAQNQEITPRDAVAQRCLFGEWSFDFSFVEISNSSFPDFEFESGKRRL